MFRFRFHPAALALTGCSVLACAQAQEPIEPPPVPNIVLVMADDMGWGDAGYQGHPRLQTPNLDAMAAAGVRFDRFYAAAPVCSPTRGGCLTGRHPYRYGIRSANVGSLPVAEIQLAEILLRRGYDTGHFGKWHLGTLTRTEQDSNRGGRAQHAEHYAPPWERGFRVCFSTEAKVPTFDPMVNPPKWAGGVRGVEGEPYGTAYWTGPDRRAADDLRGDDSRVIMDRAIPFIESAVRAQRPFFAVIWFHAPHLPVIAGPEHTRPYRDLPRAEQHYYGCMTALDEQVGRLRRSLRELGVADDTMLWFCSDNGPEGREGEAPGSAGSLRGRKRSLYEGGIRVPGLLEWPARLPAPRVVAAPCSTLDLLPTVLAALAIDDALDDRPIDGVDLLPLLAGDRDERGRPIGFQSGRQRAWIEDRYKLVARRPAGDGERRWTPELFDLREDPGERNDLAAEQPERVTRMNRALSAWLDSVAASATGGDY